MCYLKERIYLLKREYNDEKEGYVYLLSIYIYANTQIEITKTTKISFY